MLLFTIKALCSISLAGSCGRRGNGTPGSGRVAARTESGKCCAGRERRGRPGLSGPAPACRGRPHKTNSERTEIMFHWTLRSVVQFVTFKFFHNKAQI